ncbi:MAG: Trk system potassium transporter TrkA [Ponticaulis sp.]|nr:Trk system potassium transporter TrkA [Ponticaulis sp.]|tara:strand:- start:18930 stop:20309 length:1380 start_codon:yes stop_codon:yes gene_type:complete
MKIIICGAGRVGQGIARRLSSDGHNVSVIDEDPKLIQSITSELEVQGYAGHAAHPQVLRNAGAADADMIVAVTYSDEVNMVTCQVAHVLFQVQTKIARIRSRAYFSKRSGDLFGSDGLAIDVVISPEKAVADSIIQRLETPGAFFSIPFAKKLIRVVGVEIHKDTPLANTTLSQIGELFPGLNIQVLAIVRNQHLFAATQTDQLVEGDTAYLLIDSSQLDRLSELLGLNTTADQRIVLLGAGNIGLYVAEQLEKRKGRKVRLIDADLGRAETAASQLSRSIVIHGDALNPDILEEAGIEKADAVLALTNQDGVNLLASTMSKKLGAKKTIALVNAPELAMIHRSMDVDVLVDPRAVTVSQILLRLRRGRIIALYSVENGQGELAEGEVLEHSLLLDSDLTAKTLPEGIVAGALVRDNQVHMPGPGLRVKAGDRVVLFYERNRIKKVEQLFRASAAYFVN